MMDKRKHRAYCDSLEGYSEPQNNKVVLGVSRLLAKMIGQYRIYEVKSEHKSL
jgi:hypothetical protein